MLASQSPFHHDSSGLMVSLRRIGRNLNCCAPIFCAVLSFWSPSLACATTKGLSQIVTPDLQAEGDFSLSLQFQDRKIGNPFQLQSELGLTNWLEVAVFQGLSPGETIFGAEVGLIQKLPWLVSVGVINWSPAAAAPRTLWRWATTRIRTS